MPEPMLLLRLEGPLQSWGTRARWDPRDTAEEPTKSGIVGLLGSSLGYARGDRRLEELDGALRMGVRVENPGTRLFDFQTVSGVFQQASGGFRGSSDAPATVLSPRAYLQDASFLVVVRGPEDVLSKCARAVQNPRWPLFLGRRSCPATRPVYGGRTKAYESINSALEGLPWQSETRAAFAPPSKLRCVSDERPDGDVEASPSTFRPDRIRVNPARMYDSRRVYEFWVNAPMAEEAG